jgi:hypothetical protein
MMPTTTVENAVTPETAVILGRIRLDDADAAERFVESAGDLGVDFAPLAEERAHLLERQRHHPAERPEAQERHGGEKPIEIKENGERDERGHHASRQLHETRADQVPDAFRIRHNPRDQHA